MQVFQFVNQYMKNTLAVYGNMSRGTLITCSQACFSSETLKVQVFLLPFVSVRALKGIMDPGVPSYTFSYEYSIETGMPLY